MLTSLQPPRKPTNVLQRDLSFLLQLPQSIPATLDLNSSQSHLLEDSLGASNVLLELAVDTVNEDGDGGAKLADLGGPVSSTELADALGDEGAEKTSFFGGGVGAGWERGRVGEVVSRRGARGVGDGGSEEGGEGWGEGVVVWRGGSR